MQSEFSDANFYKLAAVVSAVIWFSQRMAGQTAKRLNTGPQGGWSGRCWRRSIWNENTHCYFYLVRCYRRQVESAFNGGRSGVVHCLSTDQVNLVYYFFSTASVGPFCSFHSLYPPPMWQTFSSPMSCSVLVARAERQPIAQCSTSFFPEAKTSR